MQNRLMTIVLATLLFTACKPPQPKTTGINNNIKTITVSKDSSMVNPMSPTLGSSGVILSSDLTLSSGTKKRKITQSQFDRAIKDIKSIDLSKLKGKKHPPLLGSSYKSVSIKTDKGSYFFSEDSYTDYPPVIERLADKIYKINSSLPSPRSDGKWHTLKELKEYVPSNFILKDDIEYLEIRLYTKGEREQNYSTKYNVKVRMGQTPLESFDAKLVKEFKDVKPDLSKETNLKKVAFCLMNGCTHLIGNGFMIKSDKKIWKMNTTQDILDMIDEVNTPAEVRLVLWLHNDKFGNYEKEKYQYRKVSNGYEILHEYENSLSNIGECGRFTYEMFVGSDGKISKNKLLKKSTENVGCLAMD